jgi:putative ABC transport system permease protein
MLNDLSYAFRTLSRSPTFTITVVVTIALAIGASTAIFSVTNGVLLRQLPYKDPERLVLARGDLQKRNVKDFPLSNADFLDLRNGAKNNFEDFAAVNTFRFTLPGLDGTPERIRAAAVSTNFFEMMGGRIVAGRDFLDSDGAAQPPPPAVPAGNASRKQRRTTSLAEYGYPEQRILPKALWWRRVHNWQTSARCRSRRTTANYCWGARPRF